MHDAPGAKMDGAGDGTERALEEEMRQPLSDPFAYLHDLIWLHCVDAADGLEARLYEVWADPAADDPGVRLLLSLGAKGEPPTHVWDLGVVVEGVLACQRDERGRLVVVVEPRGGNARRALTIAHRWTHEGAVASSLLVDGRSVAATESARDRAYASVLRVHDADLDDEDYVHARLFERTFQPTLLLQLSSPRGLTRSFDVGEGISLLGVDTDDGGGLVLHGIARASGEVVELSARVVDGKLDLAATR